MNERVWPATGTGGANHGDGPTAACTELLPPLASSPEAF